MALGNHAVRQAEHLLLTSPPPPIPTSPGPSLKKQPQRPAEVLRGKAEP